MFGVNQLTFTRDVNNLMQVVHDLTRYKDRVTLIRPEHLLLGMTQMQEARIGVWFVSQIEPEKLQLAVKNLGITPAGDLRADVPNSVAPRLSASAAQVLFWDSVCLKYVESPDSGLTGMDHLLAALLKVRDARFRKFLREQLGVDRRKLLKGIKFGSDVEQILDDMAWMSGAPTESLESLLEFLKHMRIFAKAEGEIFPVITLKDEPCPCEGNEAAHAAQTLAYRQELKDAILWCVERLAPWVRPLLPKLVYELTTSEFPPIDRQLRLLAGVTVEEEDADGDEDAAA